MINIIPTSLGEMTIRQAVSSEEGIVLALMLEASQWLNKKGIDQWQNIQEPKTQEVIRRRANNGSALIATINGEVVGTITILWVDTYAWDEKGEDGLAGYIHGFAISRRFAGKNIGKEILNWAVATIHAQRPIVRLDCKAENPRLCRYYEEVGFLSLGQKDLPDGARNTLFEKRR